MLAACGTGGGAGGDAASRISMDPADYPPSGQIVATDRAPVHAIDRGPRDAPAVILIHGASGNARDFTFDLVGRLEDRYRVIAVDRPGHGHTPRLHAEGESPAEQARLLDDAAARLGVERAIIVGHSYGGSVAMAWALERPGRVAGLVSLAGATMPWEGGLWAWYGIAASSFGGATVVPLVSALAGPRTGLRAVEAVFEPQEPPAGYAAHIGFGLSFRPASLRANARQVNTLKPHVAAMAERYPTLDVPLVALHGDADTVVPLSTHSARLVNLVEGAELTVLPGVGHMPHHAAPQAAVAAIDSVAARSGLR